jgi:RNA polymerase sigma factor (sigma-70 family)
MSKTRQLYICAAGRRVPVTEEEYLAYYRSIRRDRYFEVDLKTESAVRDRDGNITGYKPAKEDSLDRLMEAGEDYADENEKVEDTAIFSLMTDKLYQALDELPEKERELIDALFFSNGRRGMSEREYAAINGIPHPTIHSRKVKILAKLKKLLEN